MEDALPQGNALLILSDGIGPVNRWWDEIYEAEPFPGPAELRVGCSGWQYRHWRGDFYPAELPQSRWFAHYSSVFDTVEINNSFYRLPPSETFDKWRTQAPPGFLYAVKASRFLTHMKKLKDPCDPRLGPVLYQLPPRWSIDLERLETFVAALPRRHRHVIEFREPSWYDPRVYRLLERHGVALCHDMPGSASGRLVVGPFVYVRYHGTERYASRYEDDSLDDWADWLAGQAAGGRDVFAYFNNDTGGHAPRDAVRLRDRLHTRLAVRPAS